MALVKPREFFIEGYMIRERELTSEEVLVLKHFSQKDKPLDLEDFVKSGVYQEVEVAADRQKIRAAESRFSERTERSGILEATAGTLIESYEWFGGNSYAIRTSRFDDMMSGIDTVVEWENQEGESGEPVRLAVDFTTSQDLVKLERKKNNLEEEIRGGSLSSVKYFQSEVEADLKGRVSRLPKVVLGLNQKAMTELTELLASSLTVKGEEKRKIARNIQESYLQFILLEQAQCQLKNEIIYAWAVLFEDLQRGKPAFLKELEPLFKLTCQAVQGQESVDNLMNQVSKIASAKEDFGNGQTERLWENTVDMTQRIFRAYRIINQLIKDKKDSLPNSWQRAQDFLINDQLVRPWSFPPLPPFFSATARR